MCRSRDESVKCREDFPYSKYHEIESIDFTRIPSRGLISPNAVKVSNISCRRKASPL